MRVLRISHVIAPQSAEVADVEPPIRQNRIAPSHLPGANTLWLRGRSETALLAICLRRRFEQRHVAVLAVQVEESISVQYGARTNALGLPLDFARQKLGAGRPFL